MSGDFAATHRVFCTASIPVERCTYVLVLCLQMFCEESGDEAKTLWERIKREDDRTRVDFTPVTGRTHQVCMHQSLCEPNLKRSVPGRGAV